MTTPDERPVEGRYANYFKVGFNSFEFLLDFGQLYEGSEGAGSPTRIIAIPTLAKVWSALLADAVVQFETKFGPIPPVSEERDEEPE